MEDREVMEIWCEIKKFVEQNPGIYTTRWKNGREGVRFRAENIRGDIYISVQEHKGGNASGAESETAPDYRCIGRLKMKTFRRCIPFICAERRGKRSAGKPARKTDVRFISGGLFTGHTKRKRNLSCKSRAAHGRRYAFREGPVFRHAFFVSAKQAMYETCVNLMALCRRRLRR